MSYEIIAHIFLCVLIADFLTGVFHWLEQTYGTESWPLIGKSVIAPNIDHHKNPHRMAEVGNFFTRSLSSAIIALIVISILALIDTKYVTWQVILVGLIASCGNQVHSWSHGNNKSRLVKFLQHNKIAQTPKHHMKHHVPPFDRDYCVMTNLVNPILEKIKFWRFLEFVIQCFGVKVKRMTKYRDYL